MIISKLSAESPAYVAFQNGANCLANTLS